MSDKPHNPEVCGCGSDAEWCPLNPKASELAAPLNSALSEKTDPLGLLACPFCGGEAEIKKSWLIGWDVECKRCRATPTAFERFEDLQAAVRRWNQRASAFAVPDGSAARLTFTSIGSQTAFEIKDGSLMIFDPRDAWAKMYHLTSLEAKQLSAWIQRECR